MKRMKSKQKPGKKNKPKNVKKLNKIRVASKKNKPKTVVDGDTVKISASRSNMRRIASIQLSQSSGINRKTPMRHLRKAFGGGKPKLTIKPKGKSQSK
ncbi:MAG: hypothetical protein HeimC2_40390 [Candidatus Heimdallarchaeota archaeon LC_2]|nr:MAG: hypothetical protein HeimC2_40390 [Candidatus Heimdallarchaeota archaeon LC_2]